MLTKFDNVPAADFTIDRILSDMPISVKRHSHVITATAAFSNREQDFLNYRPGCISAIKLPQYKAAPLSPQYKAKTAERKNYCHCMQVSSSEVPWLRNCQHKLELRVLISATWYVLIIMQSSRSTMPLIDEDHYSVCGNWKQATINFSTQPLTEISTRSISWG